MVETERDMRLSLRCVCISVNADNSDWPNVWAVVGAQLAEGSLFNTIGPRFESSHRQNFIMNIFTVD